jgi:hypothetical protein
MSNDFRDDGKRGDRALEISIRIEAGDMGVILFDDIRRDQSGARAEHLFVTAVALPLEVVRELSVSDEQLVEIGRMVLAELRLHIGTKPDP